MKYSLLLSAIVLILAGCAREKTPIDGQIPFQTDLHDCFEDCGLVFENAVLLNEMDGCGQTISGDFDYTPTHKSAEWISLAAEHERRTWKTAQIPGVTKDNLWFGICAGHDGKIATFTRVGEASGDSILFQQPLDPAYWQEVTDSTRIAYTSVYCTRTFSPGQFYFEGVKTTCGEYTFRYDDFADKYYLQSTLADGTPNMTGINYSLGNLNKFYVGEDSDYRYFVIAASTMRDVQFDGTLPCNAGHNQQAIVEYIPIKQAR